MTPAKLQLKLQELFNTLAVNSNKMSELKNRLFQLDSKNKELEEAAEIAKADYLKVKNSKTVNLTTFSILKKAVEKANLDRTQGKISRLVLQKEILELQGQINSVKGQYEDTDKKLKSSLHNVEKF